MTGNEETVSPSFPPREDFLVREFGNTVLTLRRDLVFTPQTAAGQQGYLVEDPVNSKFYRLGLAEYHFVSLLDGTTTVHAALSHTATTRRVDALTEQAAAQLCQWLVEMDLAHTSQSGGADRLNRAAEKSAQQHNVARLNPLFIRLPLFRPERLLRAVYPCCGWIFTFPVLLLVAGLVFVAASRVAMDWDRFVASSHGIFSPNGYLGVLLGWLFLKIVHEMGHGLVCRKYGGFVREAGVVLIVCLPIAYVDVSSSWRFRSKWQRINTALAGMYVELVLAAVAALIWSYTDSGPLNQLCTNFVLMATLTTVLFNANPLMRFDGYYMLADFLEIPNLYGSGQQYLRYFGRRYFLGVKTSLPPWPARNARVIKVYAFAALAWRLFICVALTLTAATLFHGAGVIMAALAMVMWVAVPVIRFAIYLFTSEQLDGRKRMRFVLTAGGVTGLALLLLAVTPWPLAKRAPAIVEYAPLSVVRAGSPGFVKQLRVQSGQLVAAGDVIAILENPQLEVELADLDLQIAKSQLIARGHRNRHEMAALQAEEKHVEALMKQRSEKLAQTEQLVLRAPVVGQVLARNPETLLGTYLKEGDEIISIGNQRQKELQISVAQEDFDSFGVAVGQPIRVRLSGVAPFQCRLTKLEPRANLQPPHPALAATNGGPLVVKHKVRDDDEEDATIELLAPRFVATVELDPHQCAAVRSGQRGVARLSLLDESVGRHLYDLVERWLRKRLEQGDA